jgi:pantetheine-phosphate adenylyltransferase
MKSIVSSRPASPPTVSAPTLVVYGGSFDPVTIGHLDVIHRASSLFDRTIVALGRHPSRSPLFTVEERLELLKEVTRGIRGVEVTAFEGLLIHYCKRTGARVLVRGLRAATDFEYELQIAHANADLEPGIDTIFLPTRTKYGFISASLVREIASHGGDVSNYAPPVVCKALERKYSATTRSGRRKRKEQTA